jgi:hypothetical protein
LQRKTGNVISINKITYLFGTKTHQALWQYAASRQTSMSAPVNEAVLQMMHEDPEHLAAFEQRASEPEISRKALLAQLKQHRKI